MTVVVDTRAVGAEERAAYWAAAQEELFFPLEFRSQEGPVFPGCAHGHDLGPVQVRRVVAGASEAVRTERTITRADPENLELTMIVRGRQERVQEGRRAVLGAGDLATTDTSRPFTVSSPEPFEMLAFAIPKSVLARDAARLCRATATPIRPDAGVAAVIGPFLRNVGDGLIDGRITERDTSVGDGIVDLLRGLYADRRPRASRRALLLAEVQASIELRLHDPRLTPASIAGEHFVSVRQLHKVFAESGLTVSGWIRDRRLERCRRDLADPALAAETVSSIALSWGFRSPGHFSRAYRAAYGRAPSAERGVR